MKVLCIESFIGFSVKKMKIINGPHPKEGVVYEVIGENTKGYYQLSEFPKTQKYLKDKFIPLSEVDETEMTRNYSTVSA